MRDVGCAVIDGATVQVTVMVAVTLSTLVVPLHVLVTRTQYDVVTVSGGVVNEGLLVPTGMPIVPVGPWYH